jgi:hypothetical protein
MRVTGNNLIVPLLASFSITSMGAILLYFLNKKVRLIIIYEIKNLFALPYLCFANTVKLFVYRKMMTMILKMTISDLTQ